MPVHPTLKYSRALMAGLSSGLALVAHAGPQAHAPRRFGPLTVARMGALANYAYTDALSTGMPGHRLTVQNMAQVHQALFHADGSASGVQASDNWRLQSSNEPFAMVLAQGKLWVVSSKGALTSRGLATGAERGIETPREVAQNFIDDLHNGSPARQLRTLGACSVAGPTGVLYGAWRPAEHALATQACVATGGGPILSYQSTNLFQQDVWRLTRIGGVPVQLPRY